jgi:RecJ-like exonuclease
VQLDWEKELSDILASSMTCQACGVTGEEMVVGYTRNAEAAEFAMRCRDCADKRDCDARKLIVVCEECARRYRVNGQLLDEEGMMSVFLEECRHNLEESIDYLGTYWKEEIDVPYDRLNESLAEVDPDLFREEDGWRLRLEEEYLQLHRWFRENNRRMPNPGWRSQYVEEVIALGCTTLLGD